MAIVMVQQLDHVALSVSDLERSRRWYEEVLGLDRRYADAWPEFPVVLCAGEACVALFPRRESESSPHAGIRHVAFRTDRAGFEAARLNLERHGIATEFQDHTICHSVYLSDPDGYEIEITTYDVAGVQPADG